MKMRKESYAVIPNVAFGFGTEYHLNKDEMMVYTHLQFEKSIGRESITRTTINMLIEDLGWETSTPSRDKKNMVAILQGLESKGYIVITYKDTLLKSSLTIRINKEMEQAEAISSVDWKENPFKFNGFTKIYGDKYNLAESNGYYMIIIAYILWRTNPALKHEWKICDKEWTCVLGVRSDKTAREKINECDSFINKISGSHYRNEQGQIRQEANTYDFKSKVHTNAPDTLEKATTEVKVNSILDKEHKQVSDLEVKSNYNIFLQIFDKNTKWNGNGYKAWKETTCKVVEKAGSKKINAMYASKNPNAHEVADRLEREYQEYKGRQEAEQRALERASDRHLEELNSRGGEWVTSFKQKTEDDIMDFLDN